MSISIYPLRIRKDITQGWFWSGITRKMQQEYKNSGKSLHIHFCFGDSGTDQILSSHIVELISRRQHSGSKHINNQNNRNTV